ncbi:3D domain-containing protein [Ruminococcus sp.]|uniref:3D domain-containing protein n=1 Tax=Ruminococcus sp. TaxID=41978 RepID=UPI003527002B
MHKFKTLIVFIGTISLILSSVYYSGIGDEIKRNNNEYKRDKEEIKPIKTNNKEDMKNNAPIAIKSNYEQIDDDIANYIEDETGISSNEEEQILEEIQDLVVEEVVEVEETNNQYVGTFSITAYTWTGNVMANGEYPYYGSVASCDFSLGTTLYIENVGNFIVNDVCPTSGVIDVYMNTYEECINFGRQYCNVYVM